MLQAFADPRVDEVVLTWGKQLGKTTILGALLCWIAEMDPSSAMIACANRQMAHEHNRTKLTPILESCAPIAAKLQPPAKRNLELVDLGNMFVYYAYSGAPGTLSSRSIRWLFVNEIGLWSTEKSQEGDPLKMARDRTKAFRPRHKVFIEGKPTVRGQCRVTQAFDDSDRRRFYVPCPLCGAYQTLIFGAEDSAGGLKWQKRGDGPTPLAMARETTEYECAFCAKMIPERHKLGMLRRGRWAADGQTVHEDGTVTGETLNRSHVAGFHLSSLYSSVLTWGEVVEEFLLAKRSENPRDLQAFVNGWLADPWEVPGTRLLYDEVMAHRLDYAPGTIPGNPLGVLCAVDVQQNGLWFAVRAYGLGATSWLVRYGFVDSFVALDPVLQDAYRSPDGSAHRVNAVIVDSGYGARTGEVYDWCQKTGAIPIKGQHQYRQQAPVVVSKVPGSGYPLWMIDAGLARDALYERRMNLSSDTPGYWGLHRETGMDYGRSLCAWQRELETDAYGRQKAIWRSRDVAHEHLGDVEAYLEAAAWYYQFALRSPPTAETPQVEAPPSPYQRSGGRDWITRQ